MCGALRRPEAFSVVGSQPFSEALGAVGQVRHLDVRLRETGKAPLSNSL
jgi:hypothetical protein